MLWILPIEFPTVTVTGKVKKETGLVADIRRLADEETPEADDSMSVALGQFESRLPEPPPPPPKRRRTQHPVAMNSSSE